MAQAKQQKDNQKKQQPRAESGRDARSQAVGNRPENNFGQEQGGYDRPQSMTRGRQQEQSLQRRGQQGQAMSPFGLMRRFNEEMDRLFEDFAFGSFGSPHRGLALFSPGFGRELEQMAQWAPQTEVFERGDEIVVRADLPGMTKDDINVDLEENRIVIQGERRDERESEQGFSERSYGSFYRSIPLPEGIDGEQARADFANGMLEISLPKPEQKQRGRRLEIDEGGRESQQPQSRAKAAGR